LVWWTGIALQIGHRRSIDFDLFISNSEKLPLRKIQSILNKQNSDYQLLINEDYHREIILNWVKITRFAYMFDIFSENIVDNENFRIPSLLFLSAMKVHAISKRAKRKDYVDMYFLIKKFWINKIVNFTKKHFKSEINIKLFLTQLSYFEDIDYSEKVEYMDWYAKTDSEIKEYLTEISISIL